MMAWSVKRLPVEGPEPRLGAGLSRPLPKEHTRTYMLQVKRPGTAVMRITVKAPNKGKALFYCQNRWPDAEIAFIK